MTSSLPEFFAGYAGLAHDSGPGHPESPGRLSTVIEVGERLVEEGRARLVEARPEKDLSLARTVHDPAYVDFLEGLGPHAPSRPIDGDTRVGGATVVALRETLGLVRELSMTPPGTSRRTFVAMRPPGHHAHSGGGMGFCAINPLAILCALRSSRNPSERLAVFDFDVHHGNGTEEILRKLPGPENFLFVSTHRHPFYPGTGSGRENWQGAGGEGILDIPLPAGTDDDDYERILEEVVFPRIALFSPGAILVSAGFDAHRDDPLGDMALTEESYHRVGSWLKGATAGPCAAFLEGGYDLAALRHATMAFLSGWFGE
jgi:acetoin utilization deacetylase AcuC-like enzyme